MTDDTSIDGQLRRVDNDLYHIRDEITQFLDKYRPAVTPEDRIWAAMRLAQNAATCSSILAGRQVRVGNLNPEPLRHALRVSTIVTLDPDDYALVTADMLDAIVEANR